MDRRTVKSVLVLVNPVSGRGLGLAAARRLPRVLGRHDLEGEVILLPGPGAGRDLVRERAGPHQAVVAVGGDGTVNEVVKAVFAEGLDKPLGVIPLGFGNCLARHLGLPSSLDQAVTVIAGGRTRRLDLALAGPQVIVAFMGVGFDAAVVNKVAELRHGGTGLGQYARAIGSTLLSSKAGRIQAIVDGSPVPGRFFQVIMNSVSNYARFFNAPARPGFSVLLFKGHGPSGLLRSVGRMGLRRDLKRAADLYLPVKKTFFLDSENGRALIQIDGEPGGTVPVTCEIRPEAFEILIP